MLATIPWTTSPGIAGKLAANSTLPNPDLLYDVIINTELGAGPVGHHGFVRDPKTMGKDPTYWNGSIWRTIPALATLG